MSLEVFFEDHGLTILNTVGVILFIVNKTPHDCTPVKEGK